MPETPDVREQLAAYLAGELDAAGTAALEARMESEPWVAEAADDMADMLTRLGRVDAVDPPAGFGDRLRSALAEEIGHPLPTTDLHDASPVGAAGAAAADGWSSRPPGRNDARRPGRRAARGRLNRAVLGVAAAFAVLFVGSTAVLLSGGLSSSDTADTADSGVETTTREFAAEPAADAGDGAEDVAEDSGALDQSTQAMTAPMEDEVAADDAAGQDAASSAADATAAAPAAEALTDSDQPTNDDREATAPTAGPEVLSLGALSDDADLRNEIGRRAAAEQLLGRSAADGEALANPYRDEILRADPHPDGTPAGGCLLEVLSDADGVVVPAVAAQFTQDGEARLGYALVRSTNGDRLDQIDVWVIDPSSCAVVAVIS